MKLFKTYLISFIGLLVINGCDKPAVTELTQDNEQQLQVEILAKDTNDEYYSADSSGVVDDLNGYANVVTLSGIKITNGSTTINTAFAQTIFFDKSRPVRRRNGRLLAYRTRLLGNAKFNSVEARSVPYTIRYNDEGTVQEITLGLKHILNSHFQEQDFGYRYNSSVAFSFDFLLGLGGNSFNFDIPTPPEITGSIRLEGKRNNNTLKARLEWDGKNYPGFQIIVAASASGSDRIFPIFRLKTKDDGELIIPAELINQIPHRFDEVMFYFVRRTEFHSERNNNDFYVLSQSIHRVDIDIP
jgi:hypothetical protein